MLPTYAPKKVHIIIDVTHYDFLGGWNAGSGAYSHMAEDPEKRKTFIDSLSEFLDLYAFEGVDLDWVSNYK